MNKKVLLTLLILFSAVVFVDAQSEALLGDVDGNSTIDIVDALQVARYYVGLINTFVMPQNADVDANGAVDIIDALFIARYYVGLIDEFPGSRTTPAPTSPPVMPTPNRTVPYNTDITLAFGETVKVSGFTGMITFADVSDNRCPEGAVCVWEGEATATIDFWGSGYLGTAQIKAPPATPNSASKMDPASSTYYMVRCVSIDPYPVYGVETPKTSYTTTVNIAVAIP